jgi:hypothetical protein
MTTMRATRREMGAAALFGAVFASAVILIQAHGHFDRAVFGDGVLFRYVAQHLAATPAQVAGFLGAHGPSLRFGRIGFPVLIWLLSAGNVTAMTYVQPALMILSAAAIAAAARALLPRAGLAGSLAPFIAPGLTATLAGGFADPIAIAFALWGTVKALEDRLVVAALLFAAAVLVRENAAALALGVFGWLWVFSRRRSAIVAFAGTLLPAAVWHVIVAQRFGTFPLLDPWLGRSQTSGVPVVAYVRALSRVPTAGLILMVLQLGVGMIAVVFWRSSPLAAAAAVCVLQIISTGIGSWRYIGDAARLAAPLDVFAILALVRAVGTRSEPRLAPA